MGVGIIAVVLTAKVRKSFCRHTQRRSRLKAATKLPRHLRDALASGEKLIGDRVQMHGHDNYARAVVLPQLTGIGSF